MFWIHITKKERLLVDEIAIDLLIAFDIAMRLRANGYGQFVDNIWNWLDLGTLWSIILYWVLRGPWAAVDAIEPLLILLRYTIVLTRIYCGVAAIRQSMPERKVDPEAQPFVTKGV